MDKEIQRLKLEIEELDNVIKKIKLELEMFNNQKYHMLRKINELVHEKQEKKPWHDDVYFGDFNQFVYE
jgi:uncharacterized protein YoxC